MAYIILCTNMEYIFYYDINSCIGYIPHVRSLKTQTVQDPQLLLREVQIKTILRLWFLGRMKVAATDDCLPPSELTSPLWRPSIFFMVCQLVLSPVCFLQDLVAKVMPRKITITAGLEHLSMSGPTQSP